MSVQAMYIISVLPRPLWQSGPICLHCQFNFDVGRKSIDVVTNSAQTTPTHSALISALGRTLIMSTHWCICIICTYVYHNTYIRMYVLLF